MISCMAYIDANLKTDISTAELAVMAGYSPWHFSRVFAQEVGMPVMAYIAKRRLDCALMEICAGRKGADVAPEYGFDTYAGFYKAFTRMYGCSPRKYLSLYGTYQAKTNFFGGDIMQEREIREILTNWDIPQDLTIGDVLIMDGTRVTDHMYRIGPELVLRRGPKHQMLKDMRITNALAEVGFAASKFIAAKCGADYIEREADVYVLSHRLPGGSLPKADRFGDNRYDFGYKYGQSLAKLHIALKKVDPNIVQEEANLYKSVTEWALPNVQKQNQQWNMGLTDEFFEDYILEFGKLFDKLPKQLIHRNPCPCYVFFHNGEVSGFADFDFAEKNIRLWDVCYCSTGLLSESRGVDNIEEKWSKVLEGILHGYNSVSPFTPEEKQAVYYVLCSIEMFCIAYLANMEEFEPLNKNNRTMLQYIAENKEMICSILG